MSDTFSSMHIGTRDDRSDALLGPSSQSDRLLDDSLRVNEETEQIGTATLEQMRRQREQLEGASGLARDTHQVTRSARRTLQEIAWKIFREKLVLLCVILLLIAIDFGLAYRLGSNSGKL
ncbi:hypothetical protein M885DRAFT_528122 [Pelagophyceae sp. CCMP2097]|nr:hypothetical protein M885DRAFT_528122 [Pelagophyceae sp. CCMP2097]